MANIEDKAMDSQLPSLAPEGCKRNANSQKEGYCEGNQPKAHHNIYFWVRICLHCSSHISSVQRRLRLTGRVFGPVLPMVGNPTYLIDML